MDKKRIEDIDRRKEERLRRKDKRCWRRKDHERERRTGTNLYLLLILAKRKSEFEGLAN